MTVTLLAQIIDALGLVFGGIGILLIVYGSLLAVIRILHIELGMRGERKFHQYEHAKRIFLQKLIFGLDFFVAGDILQTVTKPSLSELYVLGGIVLIRTVLSYFLSKEVHLHKD